MRSLAFRKMHGLGNDFVILDGRTEALFLSNADVRAIADRKTGVGCDQLIVIQPPEDSLADAFMRIYNPDGSEAGACGNATRCVAAWLMGEANTESVIIETKAGLLDAERSPDNLVAVDMGPARLDWRDIPLADAADTLHLALSLGPFSDPVAVNMGNPHAVFFVPDAEEAPVAEFGPRLERHPLFPERANIGFAQILSPHRIRLRVWERGAGLTRACGSGACAALVAAARRHLTDRRAEVILDGGTLAIDWQPDDHVVMSGPVATTFTGVLDPTVLDKARVFAPSVFAKERDALP